MEKVDMTGMKIGKLTVLSFDQSKNGLSKWWCQCECGNTVSVFAGNLRRRHTLSCGCNRPVKKIKTANKIGNTKHGYANTPTHKTWMSMNKRVDNPKSDNYPFYGGRGIKICERWRTFANFLEDMGERPSGMQLDRINNEGNYEPSNCRWVTIKENTRNRRTSRFITHNGETKTVAQWAEDLGMKVQTLSSRLYRGKMSLTEMLSPKLTRQPRKGESHG